MVLTIFNGKCERCGANISGNVTQSVRVTCKTCGKTYHMCNKCKFNGCPTCNGKLLDQWE